MSFTTDIDGIADRFEKLSVKKGERSFSFVDKKKQVPATAAVPAATVSPQKNNEGGTTQPRKSTVIVTPKSTKKNTTPPASSLKSNWTELVATFDQMNLDPDLLRGIQVNKMEKPSAVQQRGILPCQRGLDVIMQAQSGTGKTATFSISVLSKLVKNDPNIQVLVLAPTRELARQIQAEIKRLSMYMTWVNCLTCVGGTPIKKDMACLLGGNFQILVGTPGRILDLLFQRELPISKNSIRTIVVDEADEMLMIRRGRSKGFKGQIEKIFNGLLLSRTMQAPEGENAITSVPPQKIFVSATMPPNVVQLTKQLMDNPITILVKNEELTLEGISQFYVDVGSDDQYKFSTLVDIYKKLPFRQAIIFCNRRSTVETLGRNMMEGENGDQSVDAVHGQMDQTTRFGKMQKFRAGETRVLVTSDLCGRGVDFPEVTLVINYDLPPTTLMYIHRVGRGGRFGRKAVALSMVTGEEQLAVLKTIEEFYFTKIDKMPTNVSDMF